MTYSYPPVEKFITIVNVLIPLFDNPVVKAYFLRVPYIHLDRKDSIFDISQLHILSSLCVHTDSRYELYEIYKLY